MNVNFDDLMLVQITFGSWDYRKTIDIEIGGNSRGMEIIDCAVGSIYEGLEIDRHGNSMLSLINEKGGTLECCDDEEEGEDWLRAMVVSAEILSLRREKQEA